MTEQQSFEFLDLDAMAAHPALQRASSGWPELDNHFRPYKGMLTSVVGTPGSGKSRWACQLAANLAHRGDNTMMLSMEMRPNEIGKHLQASINAGMKNVEKRIRLLRKPKTCRRETSVAWALEAAEHWMTKGSRLDWVIIDPYNQLEVSGKDSVERTQRRELQQIAEFADMHQIGFVLLTHPTKAVVNQETGSPRECTAYDISGSSHWNNRSDYVISVSRHGRLNKFKVCKVRYQETDLTLGEVWMRLNTYGTFETCAPPDTDDGLADSIAKTGFPRAKL